MPQLGNRTLDLDLITFSLALAIPSIDFLWTQLIAFACLYTYFFLAPPPIVLPQESFRVIFMQLRDYTLLCFGMNVSLKLTHFSPSV